MIIDASQSGQAVVLRVGEAAELRLAENPTTGFRWSVVSDAAPACRLDDGGFRGADGTPGRGGEHVWTLVGVEAGPCELRLAYRRSWEPAKDGAPGFSLRVQVR